MRSTFLSLLSAMVLLAGCDDNGPDLPLDTGDGSDAGERDSAVDAERDSDVARDSGPFDSGPFDSGPFDSGAVDTGVDANMDAGPGSSFTGYEWISSGFFDGDTSGSGDLARDVAFDAAGNFVIVGGTQSSSFPTTSGAYDRSFNAPGIPMLGSFGAMDVFVSKFDRDGNLVWSTFLGGPSYDRAYAVEIGPGGDVFVAGRAGSGFPTTSGALQTSFAGDNRVNGAYGPQDGFITRLRADGGDVVWSTYFGEGGRGFIRDIDVDATGTVYVGFSEAGSAFPFTPASVGDQPAINGGEDGYYARVSSDGASVLFGTFIGGSRGATDVSSPSVRVTPSGDVYWMANIQSPTVGCITSGAHQMTNAGGTDIVLVHFAPDDSTVFCTFFGGSGVDTTETHSLAVDGLGRAVIGIATQSSDIATTAGVLQPSHGGSFDGMIAIFDPSGARIAATYLGGTSGEGVEGIAVTPDGDIVTSGETDSDFPSCPAAGACVTSGAFRSTRTMRDAYVTRISGDLTTLRFLSYFGGSRLDQLRSVDVAADGAVVYAGRTESSDYMRRASFDDTLTARSAASYLFIQPTFGP